MEEKGSLFLKKYLYIYFLFPFQIYFIFFLEIEHSLDTFTVYYVFQIVDELTISPLIRKLRKASAYTGVFSRGNAAQGIILLHSVNPFSAGKSMFEKHSSGLRLLFCDFAHVCFGFITQKQRENTSRRQRVHGNFCGLRDLNLNKKKVVETGKLE